MVLIPREAEIITLVNKQGTVSVRELAEIYHVAEITIRRDLRKLESLHLLRRTHGGAMRLDDQTAWGLPDVIDLLDTSPYVSADALVLAPVQHQIAHTLRERALRSHIPLIAESAPQKGAIYLGPDNFDASVKLGQWTAQYIEEAFDGRAHVLSIILSLPNTLERSAGFLEGLQSTLHTPPHVVTINGHGFYNEAYQAALDALHVHPEINVIFGINDDSVMGGLQAYLDLERDPDQLVAVNVGGEGKTLFDELQRGGALRACLALFPEVVGRMAVDTALRLWNGEDIGRAVITPSVILTADNLSDYYTCNDQVWQLNRAAVDQLEYTRLSSPMPNVSNKRLSFVFHYRTHEWYANVTKAMRERAEQVGVHFSAEDVNEDLKAEIAELRRLIGKAAAAYVNDGETIILDTGMATACMVQFLHGHKNLTVITNSIAVFQRLQNNPEINLTLTGGNLHRDSQALVSRGAQLLLKEVRADKAFIVAGGVSQAFGVSCANLPEAEIRRAMIAAAREVVLLVDHTAIGTEAHTRITGLEDIDTIITDAGTLPAQRLELNQRGIKVIVAGQIRAPADLS
ncbi:MAG: DeoR family transcriptional regulator [Anaerolineae bacterium]|nr:DeoR family transcriptional regulator [Anaerolineae bacterium]